jgi:hypothetical protein
VDHAQRFDQRRIPRDTQRYEDGVIDLLLANLERLWRGEAKLANQVV